MDQPDAQYAADFYRFRWPDAAIELEFSRFLESSDTLTAETTAAALRDGRSVLLKRSRINLMTEGGSRRAFEQSLKSQHGGADWATMLEQAIFLAVERWRQGEPAIDLADVDPTTRPRWLVHPYVEYGGPTVLFGPGGAGKSMLAASIALKIASGEGAVGRLTGPASPVLYLDWEADRFVHAMRVRALAHGLGFRYAQGMILYRRMDSPLATATAHVKGLLVASGAGMLIVDSMTPARGSASEHGGYEASSMRLFDALRALDVPALIVDHVSKASVEAARGDGSAIMAYGSIMTTNRARNAWLVTQSSSDGGTGFDLSLEHTKSNNGAVQPRRALRVEHESDANDYLVSVTYRPAGYIASFPEKAQLSDRILQALRLGRLSPKEIADELGVPAMQVRAEAARLADAGKVIRFGGPKQRTYGLGA